MQLTLVFKTWPSEEERTGPWWLTWPCFVPHEVKNLVQIAPAPVPAWLDQATVKVTLAVVREVEDVLAGSGRFFFHSRHVEHRGAVSAAKL